MSPILLLGLIFAGVLWLVFFVRDIARQVFYEETKKVKNLASVHPPQEGPGQ